MRDAIVAVIIISTLFMMGCADSNTGVVLECTPPLIQSGDSCCLDADQNGVCDSDEKTEAAEDDGPATSGSKGDDVTVETGAEGDLQGAEAAAKMFVDAWSKQAYNMMYPLLTEDLKSRKTAQEFRTIMELDPLYNRLNKIELNGVAMTGKTTAEMDIMVHTNIQDIKIPAAKLKLEKGVWRVNILADVFELETFEAACSGYRYDKQYTTEDCAFDYAKKMEDADHCEQSGCHYLECMKLMGKEVPKKTEAEQCFECQPVGKTTMECILDIAVKYDDIKVCNVISELSYSNRYCTCYGGYAKAKNNGALCNQIADEEFKDMCLKGFRGEYC